MWSQTRAFPTAPNSHPPKKNRGAFYAPAPQGIQQKTQIITPHSQKNEKSPDLVDSFSIFRNRAMATPFGILSDLQKKGGLRRPLALSDPVGVAAKLVIDRLRERRARCLCLDRPFLKIRQNSKPCGHSPISKNRKTVYQIR